MSTRSSIAVQNPDGTVAAVYCHFDGYLEGVGFELMQVYNTFDRAKALVEAGDMSSPGDPYSKRGEDWQTIAPKRYGSYESYLKNVERDIDTNGYSYLFKDGKWLAHGCSEGLAETPQDLLPLLVQQGFKPTVAEPEHPGYPGVDGPV